MGVVDSYSETNIDQNVFTFDGSVNGQSFTGNGMSLDSISLPLYNVLQLSDGTVWVDIYAETHETAYGVDSLPTGSALASSEHIAANSMSIFGYENINFEFLGENKIVLEDGVNYCYQIESSGIDFYSQGKYLYAGADYSSPTHGGNYFHANTAYSTRDMCFYVYGVDNLLTPHLLGLTGVGK